MGVKLKVPYKSQVAKDAGYSHNDCGPACVNMMLGAMGNDVTIDSMYESGPARHLLSTGFTDMDTLVRLAAAYGLTLKRHNNSTGMTPDALRQFLDEGRPALLLIDYFPIVKAGLNSITTNGRFGHFANVVGYEGSDFLLHDPYQKATLKGFFAWSEQVLESCWNHGYGSSGNYYRRSCLVSPTRIAEPEGPVYAVPEDVMRRLQAKAIFEGQALPPITSERDYQLAVTWLADWGHTTGVYEMQYGDSLSKLAYDLYRDGDLWYGLAVFNGIRDAHRVEEGTQIYYPMLPNMAAEKEKLEDREKPQLLFEFTNRQVINAFYYAYKPYSKSDKNLYWKAIVALDIEEMAEARDVPYSGPDLRTLDVDARVRPEIFRRLGITE